MRLTVFSLAMYYMVKSVVQLDCPLEVAGQSYPSFHVDWSSIKVSDVTFSNLQKKHGLILNPKIPFYMDLTAVSFPEIFAHVCQRQKTSCAAVVSTPIVFSMKWHPSKLMGCNHHHKYTVTRSTARSWVFNSQSMGCKEWQAWGTQFPISLTAPSENWKRIHPPPPKKFACSSDLDSVCSTSSGIAEEKHLLDAYVTNSQYYWRCFSGTHPHCHLVK